MNDYHQTNEPSGIRLMRLMNTHMPEIIRKEQSNVNSIKLYGTGDYWSAFEQSAYLLCKVFTTNNITVITSKVYPFPVMMATISDKALRAYAKSHIYTCDKIDYKEILATDISVKDYQKWRKKEIDGFALAMNS